MKKRHLDDPATKAARPFDKTQQSLEGLSESSTRVKYDVYFVYAHADFGHVEELGRELRKRGLNWTENTMMGDPPEVARLLAESALVVFIDSGSAKGATVYQELDVARGMGKPIVSVRVEHVVPRSADDCLSFVEAFQYFDTERVTMSGVADELAKMAEGGLASR